MNDTTTMSPEAMIEHAEQASNFLKAISHPQRLAILCLILEGEKTVGDLELILNLRQPAISQQLARLRSDDLVNTRRYGKNIFYSISREDVKSVISSLNSIFCRL